MEPSPVEMPEYAKDAIEEKPARENVYTCPAGHRTWTVDRDEGVTPFMMGCCRRGCALDAVSGCYRQKRLPDERVTHEWFKPSPEAVKRLHPAERDHVERGGLVLRERDGGRRRTGKMFTQADLGGVQTTMDAEPAVYVPQRQAKEVAETLTKGPVRCYQRGGRCVIEHWWKQKVVQHLGENWWASLRALQVWLKRQG